MTRKEIGVLLLLLALCAIVAVASPAVPERRQPAERRPARRHLRHLQHRRRHRDHHRRHRPLGRIDLRAARRAAVDDARRMGLAAGRGAGGGDGARRLPRRRARPAGRAAGAAALHRHAVRSAAVSRRGPLHRRGFHERVRHRPGLRMGTGAGVGKRRRRADAVRGDVRRGGAGLGAAASLGVRTASLCRRPQRGGRALFGRQHAERSSPGPTSCPAILAAVSAIIIAFYTNSISPASHGNFYELYAIAAAVVGGCSLRGGEGIRARHRHRARRCCRCCGTW